MNAQTLLGQLVTDDGMARRARWHQPEPEMVGPLQYRARPGRMVNDYFRIDRHRVKPTQGDFVPIKIDHDGHDCIGHAEHLEQLRSGLWLVAEIYDDPPPSMRYFSPGWFNKSSGIEITHAALVDEPAQICMEPVTILPGPLADCDGRRLPPWQAELVQRAKAAANHRRGGPVLVADPAGVTRSPAPVIRQQSGPLWHRTAERVDVRPGRRIDIVVMPYEREALVQSPSDKTRLVTEIISRGAFDNIDSQANRIRVNRDHDLTRTVGTADRFHPDHPEGLVAELRIARTPLGDETLALAEDGCLDASAGFRPVDGGMRWESRSRYRVTKAWLGHIALLPDPAYTDARVLAVRGESRTPNLDRVLAGL